MQMQMVYSMRKRSNVLSGKLNNYVEMVLARKRIAAVSSGQYLLAVTNDISSFTFAEADYFRAIIDGLGECLQTSQWVKGG